MLAPSGTPTPETLERWLRARAGWESARVVTLAPVTGGASNLTCRVDLAAGPMPAVALRLQRDRGIFEPYDVLREGEVLRRLRAAGLPVPAVLFSEGDAAALGAPFLVLAWIDAPHMGEAGAEASFAAYTRAVVAVHALEWRAAGLAFLGVPESARAALQAELALIGRRAAAFGAADDVLLARAAARLAETVPADGRISLCQGDVNAFNYLFRRGEVIGIVDWEQARLSDPRSDVGHMLALMLLKGAPFGPAADSPFVRMYEVASGVHLPGMDWFRARWLYELGVIAYGWRAFNRSEPWYGRAELEDLLAQALAAL
ncbi:MAG: phosphotransferase family protein [Dehalococcoidia bacterium]|nr:phosphotransferase family protein [Dehalococcoidia bacterium]